MSLHLSARNVQCVAACPACRAHREELRAMEDELVILRIENAALRKEADEANASAADFAEQANLLHREKDQIGQQLGKKSGELRELVALVKGLTAELEKLKSQGPIVRNPLFDWTWRGPSFPGDKDSG